MIPYTRLVHAPSRRGARAEHAGSPLRPRSNCGWATSSCTEDHGIARFSGFDTQTVAGRHPRLPRAEYRGGDRVFAPTDQLARISRYIGAEAQVQLSPLGGKRWQT